MKNRIDALLQELPQRYDAVLIASGVGRRYFTGMQSSAGTLLLFRGGDAYLIIDFRYYERACKTVTGCKVLLQSKLYEQLNALLSDHSARCVGVESDYLTLTDYMEYDMRLGDTELVMDREISRTVSKLRMRKSTEEIAAIKAAQKITEDAFAHICGYIKAGRTEREIACELMDYAARHGSERPAFDYIVVSGVNSSMPHGVPTDKAVEPGEFITMDFGCVCEGYCSDMTRTVALGTVSEEMERVYHTVLAAQQAALDAVRPGAVCKEVDAAARDLIDRAGYSGCFGHGTGHSLGLEIHESPAFNTVDKTVCAPGMVITVEPGIYLEGKYGVRIEDMVLVTERGYENLTHCRKQLLML